MRPLAQRAVPCTIHPLQKLFEAACRRSAAPRCFQAAPSSRTLPLRPKPRQRVQPHLETTSRLHLDRLGTGDGDDPSREVYLERRTVELRAGTARPFGLQHRHV